VATSGGDSIVVLRDVAVATSGPGAQRIVDRGAEPQSHVIDPATGRGLAALLQVTVAGRDGATADAIATALTLVPRHKWPPLLARFGVRLLAPAPG
jgi:thiamine biosynthesis lipoprotein ApbE